MVRTHINGGHAEAGGGAKDFDGEMLFFIPARRMRRDLVRRMAPLVIEEAWA